MPGAFITQNSHLKERKQLLPGTQQRVLYNTIKYCSLSLSPLFVLLSFFPPFTFFHTFLSYFLSRVLASPFIHSLLPWCALLSDGLWLWIDNDCARGFVYHGYQRIRVITTGASVVTSRGSLPQCMEVLTVILYKIRELGLWVVFSPPGDERLGEKAEHHNAKTLRNRAILGESKPPYLFWTLACSFFKIVLAVAHDTQKWRHFLPWPFTLVFPDACGGPQRKISASD